MVLLMPMRVRTCAAIVEVGLSVSNRRQMRVRGRAAENFAWYDCIDRMETSMSRVCSAFSCRFAEPKHDIREDGEHASFVSEIGVSYGS